MGKLKCPVFVIFRLSLHTVCEIKKQKQKQVKTKTKQKTPT